jgi:hypothetical protein
MFTLIVWPMNTRFVITGINPATGKVIERVILASDAEEAKQHAAAVGLQRVVVHPAIEHSDSVKRGDSNGAAQAVDPIVPGDDR